MGDAFFVCGPHSSLPCNGALGRLMSHLRAAKVAKRAKVLENAAAARAVNTAARCAPQETPKSVLRDMPELRKCPVASKLFT